MKKLIDKKQREFKTSLKGRDYVLANIIERLAIFHMEHNVPFRKLLNILTWILIS